MRGEGFRKWILLAPFRAGRLASPGAHPSCLHYISDLTTPRKRRCLEGEMSKTIDPMIHSQPCWSLTKQQTCTEFRLSAEHFQWRVKENRRHCVLIPSPAICNCGAIEKSLLCTSHSLSESGDNKRTYFPGLL